MLRNAGRAQSGTFWRHCLLTPSSSRRRHLRGTACCGKAANGGDHCAVTRDRVCVFFGSFSMTGVITAKWWRLERHQQAAKAAFLAGLGLGNRQLNVSMIR